MVVRETPWETAPTGVILKRMLRAVRNWIIANAQYHGEYHDNVMSFSDAERTASYVINKTYIHGVDEYNTYDSDGKAVSHQKFLVNIGKPKFRGAVNYTLPDNSLCFNMWFYR